MNRRELLRSSALFGAILAGGGRMPRALAETAGFGPLAPVADDETGLPLLMLPEGFRYRSLSWAGDMMADGMPVPDLHDGMGTLADADDPDTFVLIRNHERTFAPPFGAAALTRYDTYPGPDGFAGIGGGTTALRFERGRYVETVPTLGGTLTNCAGGTTPWGSWLTCEEIVVETLAQSGVKRHGYVFEVPAPGLGRASGRPIVAMGRMKHEAVGVDPATGFVYLTEDNGPSGLYRFRPRSSARAIGAYEQGGTLEMLKVRGADGADMSRPRAGDEHAVEWVPIADPDALPENVGASRGNTGLGIGSGRSGPFLQGRAGGGAEFRRLEGAFAHGGLIYFTDTVAGEARTGVLWALAPAAEPDAPDRLRCVFVSTGEGEADNIDNLCVSPRGGIVLCEDGGGIRADGTLSRGTRVVALAADGTGAFPLAENNLRLENGVAARPSIRPRDYRGSEFAGARFSPSGDRLFVNVQQPGITFEIRGPWDERLV